MCGENSILIFCSSCRPRPPTWERGSGVSGNSRSQGKPEAASQSYSCPPAASYNSNRHCQGNLSFCSSSPPPSIVLKFDMCLSGMAARLGLQQVGFSRMSLNNLLLLVMGAVGAQARGGRGGGGGGGGRWWRRGIWRIWRWHTSPVGPLSPWLCHPLGLSLVVH